MEVKNFKIIDEGALFSQISFLIAGAKEKITLIQNDYNAFINETNPLCAHIKKELYKKKDTHKNIQIELNFLQGLSEISQVDESDTDKKLDDFIVNFKDSFLKTRIKQIIDELKSLEKKIDNEMVIAEGKYTISEKAQKPLKDLKSGWEKLLFNNMLDNFQQDILSSLNDIQESKYYEEKIKPLAKDSIQVTINSIKQNVFISYDEGDFKQLIKSFLKFLINIADGLTDLRKEALFKKQPYVFASCAVYEMYKVIKEYQEYKDKKFYYDFAVPLLNIITTKFYPTLAFCNEEFLSNVLIVDDEVLLDFSSYFDLPKFSLYRNVFYKLNLNQKAKGFFDSFFHKTKKAQISYSNNELLYSDKNNINLKDSIQRNLQSLNHFFYAEYPDLNSALLVEMILDKKNNKASKMGKNYLFITNPPQLYNAGLCEYLYNKKLKAEILYRPKAPTNVEKLALKKSAFPTKQDYSSYAIKRTVDDDKPYILQLCPFVKFPKQLYDECKNTLDKESNTLLAFLTNSQTKLFYEKNLQYVDSFFHSPRQIEDITKAQKENAKAYFEVFKSYFYTFCEQSVKKEYQYSVFSIFLISLGFYIFNKEFQGKSIYKINTDRGLYYYQSIEILRVYVLDVIRSKAYYLNESGEKITVFLSKDFQKSWQENDILFLDEFIEAIFEDKKEELSCCEFLKSLLDDELAKELKSKKELNEALDKMLKDENLAKMVLNASLFNLIERFCPFMSFFSHYPELFYQITRFFIGTKSDKQTVVNDFKESLIKEMSLPTFTEFNDNKAKTQESKGVLNKRNFLYMLVNACCTFSKNEEFVGEFAKTKSLNKLDKQEQMLIALQASAKFSFKHYKSVAKGVSIEFAKDMANSALQKLIPTHYDDLKAQYEYIRYQKLNYNFDSPLAVQKDEYITYPMFVNSRFMSFDLAQFILGSLLCTGGLSCFTSISCATISPEIKKLALQRLLSYLVIDEKRASLFAQDLRQGKDMIDDINFFTHSASIELENAHIYKLIDEEKEKEYKKSGSKTREEPILLYNEAISIICEYANGISANANKNKKLEDKQKARRLIKALDSIGQHNLKVMYSGLEKAEEQDDGKKNSDYTQNPSDDSAKNNNKKNQNIGFIGRLATVIIVENGLWMG